MTAEGSDLRKGVTIVSIVLPTNLNYAGETLPDERNVCRQNIASAIVSLEEG